MPPALARRARRGDRRLLRDPALPPQVAGAALRAAEGFRTERVAAEMLRLYESVAPARRAGV